MKKKFFLLLTFLLSFVLFSNFVGAQYIDNWTTPYKDGLNYFCDNDSLHFSISAAYSNGWGGTEKRVYCCPNGFEAFSAGCYSLSVLDQKKCADAGGSIAGPGGWDPQENGTHPKFCYVKSSNKFVGVNLKISVFDEVLGNTDLTCKMEPKATEYDDNKDNCYINLPSHEEVKNTYEFLGYSKTSDCSKINYSGEKKVNIYKDGITSLYACYEGKVYVKCTFEGNNELWYGKNFVNFFHDGKKVPYVKQADEYDLYSYDFDADDLMSLWESTDYCPNEIWASDSQGKFSRTESKACNAIINLGCKSYNFVSKEVLVKNTAVVVPPKKIDKCSDLFDKNGKTIKFINEIFRWLRVIVPILLIGFGTLDFTKAVFSDKEEDMKKNRDRFIKRIIAAVGLFFIPIFVNLLLSLANDVWSDINKDTCINAVNSD